MQSRFKYRINIWSNLSWASNGTRTFTYQADGLRTKRTNGSTTYQYVYGGDKLLKMTVGSNTLVFAYDANGTPLTATYNGTVYYYATNLQGDVIAILNSSGSPVVEYTYDAWGRILSATSSTLGNLNPLRYRGYVYDNETGLYYLQSRYYNPEMGRFISADEYASTGQGVLGYNMYAYCNNNPVMSKDSAGDRAIPLWAARTIHNEVAHRVAEQVHGQEGVYVKKVNEEGKTQRGFLDVYDPKTNSYYEVKSILSANSSRTNRQMKKYDGSEPAYNSIGPISRGNAYVIMRT